MTIAHSPLVKTAVAGADPNWGRILAAAGRSGAKLDPDRVEVWFGGVRMYGRPRSGGASRPLPFDEVAAAADCSIDAAKALAQRGTADLQRALAGEQR